MSADTIHQTALPMLVVRDFDFHHDGETVLRFQVEIYEKNFPGFRVTEAFLRDYRRQLRKAGRHWSEGLFVLCDGQRARAFLWVGLVSTMISSSVGYIKNLYVDPDLRRSGWGRELLRTAEYWAKERGASEVELDASVCNPEAVELYRNAGYQVRRLRMGRRIPD